MSVQTCTFDDGEHVSYCILLRSNGSSGGKKPPASELLASPMFKCEKVADKEALLLDDSSVSLASPAFILLDFGLIPPF